MKILLLPTSAEISNQKEMRTSEYLKTIQWIEKNLSNYETIWLECVSVQNSFIENYSKVFYSRSHNPYFENKGANLGIALKKFMSENFINQDLIVQFTGRYHFIDDYFFKIINDNPGYDLYAMDDGHSQYFTGCFALKKDLFSKWVNETDWVSLNNLMINIEKSLWNFARDNNLNVYELDSIHMDCNIFGNGNPIQIKR
jgi:hypothetical protein